MSHLPWMTLPGRRSSRGTLANVETVAPPKRTAASATQPESTRAVARWQSPPRQSWTHRAGEQRSPSTAATTDQVPSSRSATEARNGTARASGAEQSASTASTDAGPCAAPTTPPSRATAWTHEAETAPAHRDPGLGQAVGTALSLRRSPIQKPSASERAPTRARTGAIHHIEALVWLCLWSGVDHHEGGEWPRRRSGARWRAGGWRATRAECPRRWAGQRTWRSSGSVLCSAE